MTRPTAEASDGSRGVGHQRALQVDVVVEDAGWMDAGAVESLIFAAANAVAREPAARVTQAFDVVVALDSDAAVRRLNAAYRGIDKPTNVLSFAGAADTAGAAARHLGDIILARESVFAEALELAVPVAHHLQHLTVHGLLHLLGFGHDTEIQATEMEALETIILSTLGIADPYADSCPVTRA
jgi:probable rRNA maturation factor